MCGPKREVRYDDWGEPICDHETTPTGERDEEGRKITRCKHCRKEFVQLYKGWHNDASDN